MDHEGETYTRPIAEKTIDIKLIAGPSPCCHTERVLYTYGSPRLQSVEAARKTIRIPRGDGCKGDSDSPAMAEVSAMEHLNHQHCIRFVDTCEANGAEGGREIYILTSPIADTDLAHILGGCETCTPNTDIPSLFRCLINGLNYIHGEGIIHMDVKPSNILVLQGHLYFTDFGASLKSPKPGDPIEKNGTRRTRTKAYCAPEVETGQTPQTSADIFCLGAVFLECLTVYCKPTLLSDLKKDCESGDHDEEFSWAGYHGKVLEEVRDSLKKSSSGSGFKFKNLLLLCEWMMNASESQRPSASALSQCWMYADCLGLPKPLCTSEECRSLAAFKSTDEALQAALVAGHWLAAELLCNAGADVNIRCNVQRNESWEGTGNLVHLAASHGNNRFLTFLLDQGMEVNAIDSIGSTPLHIAAENGD